MEALKRASAEKAAELIEDGMLLGLGTGSTVRHLLDVIREGLKAGRWSDLRGVPTSEETRRRSIALGIPLATLSAGRPIDLTIDGADEVSPDLDLIKGLGGALLREKVVAHASDRMVVIADSGKRVDRLGTRAPLPVEVDPFATQSIAAAMRSMGSDPELRTRDGVPFVTDGGHWVLDCRFSDGIDDPEALGRRVKLLPGVLEHGLFLGYADVAVIAGDDDVEVVRRGS